MKITTFDPMIVTPHQEDVIKVFEALGFTKTHSPTTTVEIGDVNLTRMKNESGFHVDVADVKATPQDITMIRLNVDNFDEAYELLKSHGFTNTRGDGDVTTSTAKAATMVAPSGFRISLIEHFKK